MDLSTEKQRPQKVEVVNNSSEPIEVNVSDLPLSSDGSSLRVSLLSSSLLGFVASSSNSYVVTFDNILILNSDGGFAALPMNTTLYNVNQSQLDTALANIKSAYATLVANATSATLHYCRFNSNKLLQSFSYDLKSND